MSMLKHKRSIDDIYPIYNKTVLLRVDYNIPIKDSIIPKPKESRLRASLPTIRRVISRGGKAIVMSHLGRPTGHNLNVLRDEEKRKKYLKIWRDEKGTGKTTFFALCDGEEKRKILSWSSVAEEAKALGMGSGVGKTDLFASLEDEEKKRLLHRFQRDIHYGRNDNFPQLRQYHGFEEELTLRPVARRLEELLNEDLEEGEPRVVVKFADDCMHAEEEVSGLEPGQVLLLENVRFYSNENAREESERMIMARKIASYGDYFVSDAFGTSHRNSATMVGIPKVMGHGCCGYLMKKEIEAFADVLGDPPRPMVAIVGGAKVSDKILLLEHILQQIDSLLIGGAMAYTFLKAQGYQIANSFHEYGQSFLDKYGELRDIDEMAQNFLAKAQACNVQVLLPIDHICHTSCDGTDSPFITENASVPDGYMALDIGPRTIELYKKTIDESRTAVWNGPMGVFEIPTYATGSFSIAKAMGDGTQERGLLSIIGGGASATAAERCGQSSRVSHVSGGGGASLDLLEGKVLPGINALDDLE